MESIKSERSASDGIVNSPEAPPASVTSKVTKADDLTNYLSMINITVFIIFTSFFLLIIRNLF